jgi:hypothetical protein
VDPDPDRELLVWPGREAASGLDDPQPRLDRSLGIVLVRLRVAEVDEQPIAQELGDGTVEARDHLGAGGLVGADDLTRSG